MSDRPHFRPAVPTWVTGQCRHRTLLALFPQGGRSQVFPQKCGEIAVGGERPLPFEIYGEIVPTCFILTLQLKNSCSALGILQAGDIRG